MRIGILIAVFCVVNLLGCKKDTTNSFEESERTGKHRNGASVAASVQNYLRVIALGSIDVFKREDIDEILHEISGLSSSISDSSDYYAYLVDVESVYADMEVDLKTLMEESILSNGGSQEDLELFEEYGFVFTVEGFRFDIRYFLPFENSDYYDNLEIDDHPIFGTWLFTVNEHFEFPAWEYDNGDYSPTTLSYSDMDNVPIVLVSSSARTISGNTEIDVKPIESCGRCKQHNTFPSEFCPSKGHQCKCSSPPLYLMENYIDEMF